MKLVAVLFATLFVFFGCSGGDEAEEPVKPDEDATEEKSEDEASEEPAEAAEPEAVEAEEVEAPAATTEPAGFDGPKVWKYVSSFALNVRSSPDKESATVVRHVKWGDKVEVVVNGDWAKLGTGEYISTKFLSDADPALKHSKGKKGKGKKKGK